MLYDLSKDLDRESFKVRVNSLYRRGVMVELTEKTRKTLQQSRYCYLIMGWMALQLGYSLDTVKREIFKKRVNADIFCRTSRTRFGDIEEIRSIGTVTKEELSLAIDRFRKFSSEEAGIYLPEANETDYLSQIEYEVGRNARWI